MTVFSPSEAAKVIPPAPMSAARVTRHVPAVREALTAAAAWENSSSERTVIGFIIGFLLKQ
jgi:hypothetical protein